MALNILFIIMSTAAAAGRLVLCFNDNSPAPQSLLLLPTGLDWTNANIDQRLSKGVGCLDLHIYETDR
jgi:hypothetical protein